MGDYSAPPPLGVSFDKGRERGRRKGKERVRIDRKKKGVARGLGKEVVWREGFSLLDPDNVVMHIVPTGRLTPQT